MTNSKTDPGDVLIRGKQYHMWPELAGEFIINTSDHFYRPGKSEAVCSYVFWLKPH